MNETRKVPADAIRGIAIGLYIMAFFTLVWAGISEGGLGGVDYYILPLAFVVVAVAFVANGIKLYRLSKEFPPLTDEKDIALNKKTSRNFNIVFGLEGITIPIVSTVLANTGMERFTVCGIALVVGLHFYPMARIFNRTIDYYLATWATLVALTNAWLLYKHLISGAESLAYVGVGLALTTTAYGFNMIKEGKRLTGS